MKDSLSVRVFRVFNTVFLILLACVTIYPFLFVAVASVSNDSYIIQGKVGIIPMGFTLESYKRVLNYPLLLQAYANTVFYTIAGTCVNIFMTTFGAYPLSRKRFYGRSLFSFMIVFTMLFNGGLIPTFLVVKSFNLVDTVWAMILPGAVSTWYLMLMRNFFASIPAEIEESALIDGCNEFQTLFQIIIPLSTASIATISLFYAVGHWNSFFPALIYLRSDRLYPLQIILRNIVIQNQTNDMLDISDSNRDIVSESIKYSTIMVATLPILTVYPFIQKYFVKGVMVGSVKG